MRLMILGCGGMLGASAYPYFTSQGYVVDATDIVEGEPWLGFQDVRDYHRLHFRITEFKPDVILNFAALTDLEYCEGHGQEAIDTNALGSMNCGMLACLYSLRYVYISTAGIFDGKNEVYSDTDIPNPINIYGRTKYAGEVLATKVPKHYVIRCGWQMSGGPAKDKKFINKLFKQIAAGATELNVVDDLSGTPTYGPDFCKGIDKLMNSGLYGVYNMVCRGNATRYDVAQEFVRLLGVNVRVNRVKSDFFKTEYFAPRPASEKLLTTKLDTLNLNVMRDWKTCLAAYVEEFKTQG